LIQFIVVEKRFGHGRIDALYCGFLFLKTMKITVAIVIAVTNANIPKMSKTLLIVSFVETLWMLSWAFL